MMRMAFLQVAQRDCESLVTRLQEKDAETRWMENKYVTTKALHVKVCVSVCARIENISACVLHARLS